MLQLRRYQGNIFNRGMVRGGETSSNDSDFISLLTKILSNEVVKLHLIGYLLKMIHFYDVWSWKSILYKLGQRKIGVNSQTKDQNRDNF